MYSRHDLAWLNGAGWEAALDGASPDHVDALEQWRSHDWPVVVTRRSPDAARGTAYLGLAPPPDQGTGRKRRIALQVHEGGIARCQGALALNTAAAAAPPRWRDPLSALLADADRMALRTYGSLALQAITGMTYLTDTSDIDLLFKPANPQELDAGLEVLQAHARHLPLDGEIVFPGGAAVSWKEWLDATAGTARVLVKDSGAVRLATTASLLAALEG